MLPVFIKAIEEKKLLWRSVLQTANLFPVFVILNHESGSCLVAVISVR
jgi:hypothetical protein